jgi:hypothetical protein
LHAISKTASLKLNSREKTQNAQKNENLGERAPYIAVLLLGRSHFSGLGVL